jgi:hypothetical protein
MQFFHDKDNSSLEFHDIQCPSKAKCIAVGSLVEKGKSKGTSVITTDGGAHWSYAELKEMPLSLFFLNDSIGWMITDKGVWRTEEGGSDWKKINGTKGIVRVWFLDESHGFAAADEKSIYESQDGGKSWTKLNIPDVFPMQAKDTAYDWIVFSGQHGLIWGSWNPNHAAQQANWIDPSRRPHGDMAAILVETLDGGKTWKQRKVATLEGRVTCVRFMKDPRVLGLVEYVGGTNERPSEIFDIDLSSNSAKPLFKQTGVVARDMVVLPSGEAIVAAMEVMGKLSDVPIPGKLRMLDTTNLSNWSTEKVDYRAVARETTIAVADPDNIWVATDTGMILKRVM